jgi:hypothetical protein
MFCNFAHWARIEFSNSAIQRTTIPPMSDESTRPQLHTRLAAVADMLSAMR